MIGVSTEVLAMCQSNVVGSASNLNLKTDAWEDVEMPHNARMSNSFFMLKRYSSPGKSAMIDL